MKFTNLNVKSHYSLLNSTLKVDTIINDALNNDYEYAALVDHNYFCGALEFIKKCQYNQLIPILGVEFEAVDNEVRYPIVIYAKNTKGFKKLEKLSSALMLNDTFDVMNLALYQEDTLIVIDLLSSSIYQSFLLNEEISADMLRQYQELLGEYYYYFENNNDIEFQNLFRSKYQAHKELAAGKIFYAKEADAGLHYLLKCLAKGELAQTITLRNPGKQHLLSYAEIEQRYSEKVIENTKEFIALFEIIEPNFTQTLPQYRESEEEINDYIKQLSLKGLRRRLQTNEIPDVYLNRLSYEFETVMEMGYSNYFLIVYDYVLFARKNNILVGPGRGSSAGSLMAYCLGITNVDPIEHKLIFERFLNPERLSLPDIDVDFQDDKRDQIVAYLQDKYGHENVGHIITFGTFQAKNSIRDLGRVLAIPNYRSDLILKLIPSVLNVRLSQLIEQSKQLQVVLQANDDLNYLYHQAVKLEGINRHISTHAAGIIISKQSLVEYCPVLDGINDTLMVQYSMDYLEDIGLYKMDVLGLKNLSILSDILKDLDNEFSLNDIPLNDKKTLDLMSKGNTLGVFQFESAGVIKVLKKMKVDSINDMVATTALFRPGPMQYIDEYIARKNKEKSFDYIHLDLQEILGETYGIIVYQEQIMQICQIMANFTLAKADIVRKGMAKKDEKLLQEIKEDFVGSAVNNGYTNAIATKVYDMILLFSNYGFNKAHAYSYALLGYYLAYLKANYPKVFFKNVLSANIYSVSKLKSYLYEMKQYDLTIAAPDLNKSTTEFLNIDDVFILPLISIKGLGDANAQLILEEREKNGFYIDYLDTIIRLSKLKLKKSIIENLIFAGAFDSFEYNRKTMIENLAKIEQYIEISKVNDDQIMLNLDFVPKPKIIKFVEDNYSINQELNLLGLYILNHPLDKYLNKYEDALLNDVDYHHEALAIIDTIKEIRTKKGQLMAFIGISDQLESKTLVAFPEDYSRIKAKIKTKNIVLITGKVDEKDDTNIILRSLRVLD